MNVMKLLVDGAMDLGGSGFRDGLRGMVSYPDISMMKKNRSKHDAKRYILLFLSKTDSLWILIYS